MKYENRLEKKRKPFGFDFFLNRVWYSVVCVGALEKWLNLYLVHLSIFFMATNEKGTNKPKHIIHKNPNPFVNF